MTDAGFNDVGTEVMLSERKFVGKAHQTGILEAFPLESGEQ